MAKELPGSAPNSDPEDFRLFLQAELMRRCRKNPRYSLRAFARALEFDPSTLVKVMKGHRPLTSRTVSAMASRLGLVEGEIQRFVEFHSRQRTDDEAYALQITLDAFTIASEFHYYSLLILMDTDDFKSDPKWMGRKLGLKSSEVEEALTRLTRAGFIAQDKNGNYRRATEQRISNLGPTYATAATRNFQRQALERAMQALEGTPSHRDHCTLFTAVDSDLIPEAKTRMLKFRRSLCKFLMSGKKKDSLYTLTTALFPLPLNSGDPLV